MPEAPFRQQKDRRSFRRTQALRLTKPSRKKLITLDFTDEIDEALQDWTCPRCLRTYGPPLTNIWHGVLEQYVCEKCAKAS